jgi:hypothetical protein
MADCELAKVTTRCNFRGQTAFVHAPGLKWLGKKLKSLIPNATAARSSLFAHEIVFTHFHREDHARSQSRQSHFKMRFASTNFASGQNGASMCGHGC